MAMKLKSTINSKDESLKNNFKESMIEKEVQDKLNLSTEGENNESNKLINLKLMSDKKSSMLKYRTKSVYTR
jgi:hypothetical protein